MDINFGDYSYPVGNINTLNQALEGPFRDLLALKDFNSSQVSPVTQHEHAGTNLEIRVNPDSGFTPDELNLLLKLEKNIKSITFNTADLTATLEYIKTLAAKCTLPLTLKLNWDNLNPSNVDFVTRLFDEIEVFIPDTGLNFVILSTLKLLKGECKLLKLNIEGTLDNYTSLLARGTMSELVNIGLKQLNLREVCLHDKDTMEKHGQNQDLYDFRGVLYPENSRVIMNKLICKISPNYPEIAFSIETSESFHLKELAKLITGIAKYM